MNPLYASLLSWAVTLSGYPAPDVPPDVLFRPASFFHKYACNNQPCKVMGWYAGGRAVYLDDRLDPQNSLYASSIVVHEMVHYLQGIARGDDTMKDGAGFSSEPSCSQIAKWENEAYAVQREYILRYGVYMPVGRTVVSHCTEEKR